MEKRSLQTGVAYHGNRMPSHVRTDMERIAAADLDIVVHMLSHIDWERHKRVMGENFRITESLGLEVWVDNWGLGGIPGDTSHFLCEHPEARMVYSNGVPHPRVVCLNNEDFFKFTCEWLDTVAELGGKTVFWDEPNLPQKVVKVGEGQAYTCACPTCRKLFLEKYGHDMPVLADAEVAAFRAEMFVGYFRRVTAYSASLGLKNVCCFVPSDFDDPVMSRVIREVTALPHMDNMGTDPYWYNCPTRTEPYGYVYDYTRRMLEIDAAHGKEHNLWLQTYKVPAGREEEIVQAAEAAYDAGARCVLAWGYMGSESNSYGAELPERTWVATVEAMRRIRGMERDRILAENRAKYRR